MCCSVALTRVHHSVSGTEASLPEAVPTLQPFSPSSSRIIPASPDLYISSFAFARTSYSWNPTIRCFFIWSPIRRDLYLNPLLSFRGSVTGRRTPVSQLACPATGGHACFQSAVTASEAAGHLCAGFSVGSAGSCGETAFGFVRNRGATFQGDCPLSPRAVRSHHVLAAGGVGRSWACSLSSG